MDAAPIHRAGHWEAPNDVNYNPGSCRDKISKGRIPDSSWSGGEELQKTAIQEHEMH